MSRLTIRQKLLLFTAFILIIPSISIGIFSYRASHDKITDQMRMQAQSDVRLSNQLITQTLLPELNKAEYLSMQINGSMSTPENAQQAYSVLKNFQKSNEKVVGVFTGFETGAFYNEPETPVPAGYNPTERDWYKAAMKNSEHSIVTEPYIDAITGTTVVTVAHRMEDGKGVVGYDLDVGELKSGILSNKIGKKGYLFIADEENNILIHPSYSKDLKVNADVNKGMSAGDKGSFDAVSQGEKKHFVYETNELTGWKIAGIMVLDEIDQEAEPIFNITIVVILVSIIIGGLTAFFIIRNIVHPLRSLVAIAEKVSDGDLREKAEADRDDEIGQLAQSFNRMVDSLKNILISINQSSDHLEGATGHLAARSKETGNAARDVADNIAYVAEGSEKQMNSSDESVKAMEEISIGVQRIAESSSEVSESAIQTTKEAQRGKRKIEGVVYQMDSIRSSVHEGMEQIKDLNAHSDEIGQIISVITQISDQTNLLALNAAIEAARAGEHGKGFAVVAEEVRKLAEESKRSADQISTLITTLQQATNQSVAVIRKSEGEVERGMEEVASAGETFTHILKSIERVAEEIQEVSATSEEISASSEEVTASVAEMSTIAQKTTTSTKDVVELSKLQLNQIGENIEAIEELRKLASELQKNVHRFKL